MVMAITLTITSAALITKVAMRLMMVTEKACEERKQNDRKVQLLFSASLECGSSSICGNISPHTIEMPFEMLRYLSANVYF